MKLKAVFFMLIFALSLCMPLQHACAVSMADCCAGKKMAGMCTKSPEKDSNPCDQDHCNPFMACSNTPVVAPAEIILSTPTVTLHKTYAPAVFHHTISYSGKHWQPPEGILTSVC